MSREDEYYALVANSSYFDYKEDYYKMRDLTVALLSDLESRNKEITALQNATKHGITFKFDNHTQFIPLLNVIRGISYKGKRPKSYTTTFEIARILEWLDTADYALALKD